MLNWVGHANPSCFLSRSIDGTDAEKRMSVLFPQFCIGSLSSKGLTLSTDEVYPLLTYPVMSLKLALTAAKIANPDLHA